jgi:hypothetical protein
MADIPPVDSPLDTVPHGTSKIQRFLRKARGQLEKPVNANLVAHNAGHDVKISGSDANSGYETSILNVKQATGEVNLEGGKTRFYEPIPEYEGRHRWDPRAEWTEQEEKQLVRKVSIPFLCYITTSINDHIEVPISEEWNHIC